MSNVNRMFIKFHIQLRWLILRILPVHHHTSPQWYKVMRRRLTPYHHELESVGWANPLSEDDIAKMELAIRDLFQRVAAGERDYD